MKILAYSGDEAAQKYFPGADLYKDNPPQKNFYDGVYLENLLQQMLRREVVPALQIFRNCLVDKGRIVIAVPSLEWACREISTKDNPSILAYASVYGTDEDPHLSGFTLLMLRKICEAVGFETEACYAQDYKTVLDGEEIRGRSNVYIGINHAEDAGEAIP